jgi:hypothetical protein
MYKRAALLPTHPDHYLPFWFPGTGHLISKQQKIRNQKVFETSDTVYNYSKVCLFSNWNRNGFLSSNIWYSARRKYDKVNTYGTVTVQNMQ